MNNKESIEAILANGFKIWRKNKIISIPFVLYALALILLIILFTLFALSFLSNALSKLFSEEAFQTFAYIEVAKELIFTLLPILLLLLLFALIVSSFFLAGVVGMTKEAMQKGKTSIGDMLFYGKKKFPSLFFAVILMLFLQLLGSIFLIPGIISFFILNSVKFGVLLSALGISLLLLYSFILGLIFTLVPQVIVVDDLNAFDGIKRAYSFFMNNKLSILILWVATSGISGILYMLLRVLLTPIFLLILTLGLIGLVLLTSLFIIILLIVLPTFISIVTLWWTALYLNRTGKKTTICQ